jgi:hypothetical protein
VGIVDERKGRDREGERWVQRKERKSGTVKEGRQLGGRARKEIWRGRSGK